jgi:hypothetical protein
MRALLATGQLPDPAMIEKAVIRSLDRLYEAEETQPSDVCQRSQEGLDMPDRSETTLRLEWTNEGSRIFRIIRFVDMAHIAAEHDEPQSWQYHELNEYAVLLFPAKGRAVVNKGKSNARDSQWMEGDSVAAAIQAYDTLLDSCG